MSAPIPYLPGIDVPDIEPDFSAPFFTGLQLGASYLLAGCMIVVLGALVVALAALAFRGLFSENVRALAGAHILKIFFAAAGLGAVNGLFGWFVNFNFGF